MRIQRSKHTGASMKGPGSRVVLVIRRFSSLQEDLQDEADCSSRTKLPKTFHCGLVRRCLQEHKRCDPMNLSVILRYQEGFRVHPRASSCDKVLHQREKEQRAIVWGKSQKKSVYPTAVATPQPLQQSTDLRLNMTSHRTCLFQLKVSSLGVVTALDTTAGEDPSALLIVIILSLVFGTCT